MANINYEVVKTYGQLDSDSSAPKELRLISWNGAKPKYDLRGWYKDEEGNDRMTKGVTMDREELISLRDLIDEALGGDET